MSMVFLKISLIYLNERKSKYELGVFVRVGALLDLKMNLFGWFWALGSHEYPPIFLLLNKRSQETGTLAFLTH